MQGDAEVIEFLNEALTAELTAINQYFIHAKMCENWGYLRLAEKNREESIDEMKDAETLMDRILFLEGVPNMQRYGNVLVGETVPEQFDVDLQLEYAAVERYNRGIALCIEKNDGGTREILEHLLVGEEEHADWLEAQQQVIADIGIQNYLSEQLHG